MDTSNIFGDNLCWIKNKDDEEIAKALPESEFLESCRRYRNQIATERGEYTGGRTIAQLEEEVERLQKDKERLDWLDKARWDLSFGYSSEYHGNTAYLFEYPEVGKGHTAEAISLRDAIDQARAKTVVNTAD